MMRHKLTRTEKILELVENYRKTLTPLKDFPTLICTVLPNLEKEITNKSYIKYCYESKEYNYKEIEAGITVSLLFLLKKAPNPRKYDIEKLINPCM